MTYIEALGKELVLSALKLSLSSEYGRMEKPIRPEQPRGEIIDSTKESKRAKRRRLRKQTA